MEDEAFLAALRTDGHTASEAESILVSIRHQTLGRIFTLAFMPVTEAFPKLRLRVPTPKGQAGSHWIELTSPAEFDGAIRAHMQSVRAAEKKR